MKGRIDALARRIAGIDRGPEQRRERLAVLGCCLALALLPALTRPGRILADTKIDMAVNPLGFLTRSLHLWDPEQFGQVQNQAAGYLFPMGPFFALGRLLQIPEWIVQRLWLALLLCAAFLGARKLAERLGLGGPVTRLLAGLAYALAPGGLAALGQISSEYMPFAMLPWIVLPLVGAAEGGSRIRAAARSGVAVALCGGINATATGAVLVVPVVYLLTRPRTSKPIRLLAWWSAAVVPATAWWSVTLPLVGRYAFSWLTYTEKASTTTQPTGLMEIFRGTERWVSYLVENGQVWWPVGYNLSVTAIGAVVTVLAAALGLAGLLRKGLPERAFILITLLLGIVIIGAGHVSVVEGPLAAPVRHLIDGPLAPLRNLHKFDGLVRLPLALGLAHLLHTVERPRLRLGLVSASVAALCGLAGVSLVTGLSGPGDFRSVPQYWRDAADWLNSRAGDQGVLAVPGSAFGEYTWGRPMDDIMQPLLTSRWGVRQLVPAGSPGYTRLLDAIDERLASGRPSPGLSQVLSRMGVRYLLVRNDLSRSTLGGDWPARIHQSLDHSAGLRKAASFGAPIGDPGGDAITGFDQPYAPVEVYEVADADDVVSLTPASRALRVYGGPETLLTLADEGLLRGRDVVLDGDDPQVAATPVVSDSLRAVQRNFGEVRQTSPTLTRSPQSDTATRDVLDPGWSRYATYATYSGIKDITASTSRAAVDAIPGQHDLGYLPYAAMDGDPFTQWETSGWNGPVGQWIKVSFQQPIDPGAVTAAFVQNSFLGPPPARIAVETQAGRVEQSVAASTGAQRLQVPPGRTSWLRIRILALNGPVTGTLPGRVAISELTVGGLHAVRSYRLPNVAAGAAVLARSPGAAGACMQGSVRWVCSDLLETGDEDGTGFDRSFTLSAGGPARITGTARLTDETLIEKYATLGSTVTVHGSSAQTADPVDQPRSAFDGDATTTWIAGAKDTSPTMTISWGKRRTLDHLTISRPPLARGPLSVRIEGGDGTWRSAPVDAQGRLTFSPLKTDKVTLTFSSAQLPLQITDISIPGVDHLPDPASFPLTLACGFGPNLQVNGQNVQTQATGTMGDLLAGRPLRYTSCGSARVTAGTNTVRPRAFDPYLIDAMVVDPGGALAAAPTVKSTAPAVRSWTPGDREVDLQAAQASYLVVNENYNAGWRATVGGTVLRPVRLDGWKQAWAVPAGTAGTVHLAYTPDTGYRLTLLIGLNLLVVLGIAALWPVREERSPLGDRAFGFNRWAAGGLAAAIGFWLAGPVGAGVGAVFAVLPRRWAGRLVPTALAIGGLSLIVDRWVVPHDPPGWMLTALGDVVPQVAGMVIVGRLVALLADAEPPDPVFGIRPSAGLVWRSASASAVRGPGSRSRPPAGRARVRPSEPTAGDSAAVPRRR